MAIQNATHQRATAAQITVAGMTADLYGSADKRPPLVLLHGLTFDRRIWQPVLDELARIDPGRQILSLDLPGHGDSPDQLPHSMEHVAGLVHQAVTETGLDAPVMVGHSISGGTVSLYAARYPTNSVINLDGLPDPALLARLRSAEKQIRGDGFPGVWAALEQGFGADQLPPAARELVASNCHPRQDLAVSYWEDVLSQAPGQVDEMLAAVSAAIAASGVPYLLIAGAEPPAEVTARISDAGVQLTVEVWAATGHFPHLAHPGRFAQRLAATARRPLPATLGMTAGEMDLVIDAHFDAERRGDVAAILDTVSDDIVHELFGAGLGQLRGKPAVQAFYEQLSQDLYIDAYTTVRRIHGPDHAWEEGVVEATAKGRPFGFEGGGRPVTYQLNHLFEFRNGLICRELGIPDSASVVQQLSQPA